MLFPKIKGANYSCSIQITKKPESHSGFLSFLFYKNIAVNPLHIANENTKISTH